MSSHSSARTGPRLIALGLSAALLAAPAAMTAAPAAAAPATGSITISKADYADRMSAMWMAECVGNWTGLVVEHDRPNGSNKYDTQDPFYTDADWGTVVDWQNPDPCGADDDTDIEYSYLHHMAEVTGDVKLTAADIADVWKTYINSYVWFSNSAADLLVDIGVQPPSTSLSSSNQHRNIIDAQLTTEIFGALAPGRPDVALDIAELPIRTTAGGFATHAAQFNVLLYTLAPLVDQDASGPEQIRWLIDEARKYLPDDSRISEIIDWVTGQYDANPGEPWENMRDRIFDRYQKNSVANGFNYIIKYESAVNLAAQVSELLHGGGDLLRTLQIGVLHGWDADNPTASNAGLLGLMYGTEKVKAEFTAAGIPIVERFNANRTRDNMTDYLPDDPEATDTFTMMGQRAIPLIDQAVKAAGGTVTDTSWTIPLTSAPASTAVEDLATVNPDVDLYVSSGNNQVLRAGGNIAVSSNLTGDASLYTTDTSLWPSGRMAPTMVNGDDLAVVADGFDQDTRGQEEWDRSPFFTGTTGGGDPVVETTYSTPITAESVRLIGGGISAGTGWATGATVEARTESGNWVSVPTAASTALDPAQPFQQTDLVFENAMTLTGVRVTFTGTAGGVLNLTEIDPMSASRQVFAGFDVATGLSMDISVNGVTGTTADAPAEVVKGSDLTVRYTVVNTGDAPLQGLTLRDGDGTALTLASGRAPAVLAPGDSWTGVLQRVAPEGAFTIAASALARDDAAVPVHTTGAWYGVGTTSGGPGGPGDGSNTDGKGSGSGSLAVTGSQTGPLLAIGGGLLLAGLAAFGVRFALKRRLFG